MKSATSRIVVPGPNTAATPSSLERLDVVVGDDPADRDQDVVQPLLLELAADLGHERHVRARQDRQADDVHVLLERCRDDHVGRLAEARVDDLEALVTQAAREDLRAAVVAVEARLGDQHLERSIGHRLRTPT